jgi:TolB-like protein
MTEAPRPLTSGRSEVSPAVERVVAKALAKSPADRYASADELAVALDQAMDQVRSGSMTPVSTPVPPASPIGKSWAIFGISTAVGMGLIYAMVQRYALPKWVLLLAVLLLVAGAVMMLMTTWVENKRVARQPLPRWAGFFNWENTRTGGFLALGLWAILATMLVLRGPGGSGEGGAIRLAVLPFLNRGASDHDYFVDGVTDEVRGKLTRVAGFEVIARSSSDQYRATTKSPADIGRELGVDYLLTGTVTWLTTGGTERVQVVPEMIEVKTGASRWQQSFSGSVTDVLQLQSSIASEVARALGVALGSSERQEITDRPTENAAAYDLYLKGRGLTSRDPNSARQAASFFEQAVALDQEFVEAWSGLATAQSIVYANGNRDPISANRAKEAAQRAYDLDPTGASGLVALLNYNRFITRDFTRAREYARAAIKAAPNDAEVLVAAAAVTSIQGYADTALILLDRARDLDPRSGLVADAIQRNLLFLRRYPEAISAGETARELSTSGLLTIQYQAMAYIGMGDSSAARRVVVSAQTEYPAPVLAAQFAGFYETSWLLSKSDLALLFRLTPAAFDNDRAWWGQSLATAHWDQGDRATGRAYADSALAGSEEQLRANPDDAQLTVLYGVMLAYLGREAEAVAHASRALDLGGPRVDPENGYYIVFQAIRINLALGRLDPALELLSGLLTNPGYISPAWVRLDPMFRPIRGHPRFEALAAGSTSQ